MKVDVFQGKQIKSAIILSTLIFPNYHSQMNLQMKRRVENCTFANSRISLFEGAGQQKQLGR